MWNTLRWYSSFRSLLISSWIYTIASIFQVHDEIEQLMDDDGDMAEMYLTEKKERMEAYLSTDGYLNNIQSGNWVSQSAPVSPTCSSTGQPEKDSSNMSFSKHESSRGSSTRGRHVEELEMLLEAYFVGIDNTLSKLLSVRAEAHWFFLSFEQNSVRRLELLSIWLPNILLLCNVTA